MRLETASTKAIKHSILNYHYSKSVPMVQCAFSVFNSSNEFCGTICYAIGANNNIAKPFKLNQREVCELVRVALNGKQESTSKAVSISLKLLKKKCPLIKLVVSYADTEQGHAGTIYQATNWYFIQTSNAGTTQYILNGKRIHGKTIHSTLGTSKGLKKFYPKPKHKYIYPLHDSVIELCKSLSKPYPKNASVEQGSSSGIQPEGDSRTDPDALIKV